jgi:hypothetical protein
MKQNQIPWEKEDPGYSAFWENEKEKIKNGVEIDGYKFSMPSIGVENSVTDFLIRKMNDERAGYYNDQNYDFLFFLGDKNNLIDEEIENLIIIFNEDLDKDERSKIKSIINRFKTLIGYTIKVENKIIDLKSNLDLENIWKD